MNFDPERDFEQCNHRRETVLTSYTGKEGASNVYMIYVSFIYFFLFSVRKCLNGTIA